MGRRKHYSVKRLHLILDKIRKYFRQRYPTEYTEIYNESIYQIMQCHFGDRTGGIPKGHLLWKIMIQYDYNHFTKSKDNCAHLFIWYEKRANEYAVLLK